MSSHRRLARIRTIRGVFCAVAVTVRGHSIASSTPLLRSSRPQMTIGTLSQGGIGAVVSTTF